MDSIQRSKVSSNSPTCIIDSIDDKYFSVSLENFETFNAEAKRVFEYIKQFVSNESERKGLFLCGNVGSGKTHLAVGAIKKLPEVYANSSTYAPTNEILDFYRAQRCRFLPVRDFMDGMIGFGAQSFITNMLSYDAILLDDLTPLQLDTRPRIEAIFALIDGCYRKNRRLFITSNFMLEEFSTFDSRITSRIAEMCDLVVFKGADYRLKKLRKSEDKSS